MKLNLQANSAIYDSGFIQLSRLNQLEVVNLLCNDDIGDRALIALANLPVLREIYLGPAKITTAGFSYFIQQRCSTLTFLVTQSYHVSELKNSLI